MRITLWPLVTLLVFLTRHCSCKGYVTLLEYKTEPTFTPPLIEIYNITKDRSRLQPGYIFLDPRHEDGILAPLIIENDGNIIFWGGNFLEPRSIRAQDFYVCDYLGEKGTHLCWSEVKSRGKVSCTNRVLDNTYRPVKEYDDIEGFSYPNPHEFRVVDNGKSLLQAVYRDTPHDLVGYKGPKDGAIMDGCFQEVDMETQKEIFHWCALDHFQPWESYVYLDIEANKINDTLGLAGKGTKDHSWDYMHLNALDKNFEGDYIVSARHFDTLIKVAGLDAETIHGVKPGTVLWRLGGKLSNFTMRFENMTFARQHDVQFIETTATETTLSFFNNAGDGVHRYGSPPGKSDGRIIVANNETKEAYLLRNFSHPEGDHSGAQGAMTYLPNKNSMVGWGSRPSFSEFSPDGEILLHGAFGIPPGGGVSYRVTKSPWIGMPHWDPKLLAYSLNCDNAQLVAYVSWNGATEVRSWRFYVSTLDITGPWKPAGVFPKQGFETQAILSSKLSTKYLAFMPFVHVEALDANGHVLGNTSTETWVPDHEIKPENVKCSKDGCYAPPRFEYDAKYSKGHTCPRRAIPSAIIRILVMMFLLVEIWVYLVNRIVEITSRPPRKRRLALLQGSRIITTTSGW